MNSARRRPPAWALVSAAWIVPGILAGLRPYLQSRLFGRPAVTWRDLVWEGGDWLIYGLLTPVVFFLGERFPLRADRLGRNLSVHFLGSIGLCAAWAGLGKMLQRAVMSPADAGTFPNYFNWMLISLPFGVAVYFCVLGAQQAIHYFAESRRRESQLAEARLGALRMQLQPHFLYNSLNAITVVVRDQDTGTAARMLEQLGEMLHRVMRTDRPLEVPLREELDFIRQYLAIEQMRFSDRLRPGFDVPPDVLEAAVPDFVLQPLVENALRHGLAKRVGATQLLVEARREGGDLVLAVIDDGPGPALGEREGVGLANTRERLATLYAGRATLTLSGRGEGGTAATIRLPYREIESIRGRHG